MDDENKLTNKKDYDPQKDFIVETPQLVEEIIHIKSISSFNPLSNSSTNRNTDSNNNNNNKKIRKYEKGKFLGKGGFAKCFEMKCCESKRFFAAKVFEKKALVNARSRKKLINEIKLHKKLQHENIVNFEHFFEDKENVYILLELCTNQTLNELLKRRKRLTDLETLYYCKQIIEALIYIHNFNIIHRDLKLGNLFISNNLVVKLGDFGLAAKIKFPGQRRKTICGTPNYIAPEVLEKKNGHSFEVDIWSLGVIMYTLLVGKPPFETPEVKTTYKKIRLNNFSFPENLKMNSKAKDLINKILVLDPIKRPTLTEILESEYFKIFESLPERMPISSLALPPTKAFVEKFLRKEKIKNEIFGFENNFNNDLSSNSNGNNNNDENYFDSKSEFSNEEQLKKINQKDKSKLILLNEKNELAINNNNIDNNGFTANLLLNNSDNKQIKSNGNNKNNFLRNSFNRFNTLNKQGNVNNNEKNCNTESSTNNNLNNKNLIICENILKNKDKNNLNEYYTDQYKEDQANTNNNNNVMSKFYNDSEKSNKNANQLISFKTIENDKTISNNAKSSSKISNAVANNIINNNFFINVGNINNMELKIDENFVKKIGNNYKIIIKEGEENNTENNFKKNNQIDYKENNKKSNWKINNKTKIKKILEYGNFTYSSLNNDKTQIKISFYVFNIANTYLGIYYSDSSTLIKNFNKKDNSKSQYLYIDNNATNSIKFDNVSMESYLTKKNGISEDLYKKFEVLRQFNKKYENFFLEKISEKKNYKQSESDSEIANLSIRKIIKNENVILLKLSNKIIQIFFMDNSKLAMTTDGEEVFYKNKKTNEFVQDCLPNILSSENQSLVNKIKYAKNILINFVKNEKEASNKDTNLIDTAGIKLKK